MLKGIWKVNNVRMAGANIRDFTKISYLVIDPGSNYLAIFLGMGDEGQFVCEDFKIEGDGEGGRQPASHLYVLLGRQDPQQEKLRA